MSESNHESADQSPNHSTDATDVAIFDSSSMYWKLCTILLGIGFLIAIASHGGPSTAHADEYGTESNILRIRQLQAEAIMQADANRVLSIGGFDTIGDQAAFVIVNEDGQRVGALPMRSISSD